MLRVSTFDWFVDLSTIFLGALILWLEQRRPKEVIAQVGWSAVGSGLPARTTTDGWERGFERRAGGIPVVVVHPINNLSPRRMINDLFPSHTSC